VLEGRRFLVFRCLFSPAIDPKWTDAEIAPRLVSEFGPDGPGFVRRTCDKLHLYVTKGAGARALEEARRPAAQEP